MKIDLNFRGERQVLGFELEGRWFQDLMPSASGPDFDLKPVAVNCELARVENQLVLTGRIETVIIMECGRCLEEALLPLKTDFEYLLVPAGEEELPPDRDIPEDEPDVFSYQGESLEIEPLIFEQIVLQIPIKVLCKDGCRGLCPVCGANQNLEACRCVREELGSKFSSLKNMKL